MELDCHDYPPRGLDKEEEEEEEEDQDQSEEDKNDDDDDDDGKQRVNQQHRCQGQPQHLQQPQLYGRLLALASEQQSSEYARLTQGGLGQPSSKLRLKCTQGKIVEVQGGHVVRSIGRKDRHSKVCTSKGPRDRRVRLSADTAIQFYDLQDRLGCERPSKAIDWLIEKAKAAIDSLAELPMPNPTASTISTSAQQTEQDLTEQCQHDLDQCYRRHESESAETVTGSNSGLNSEYNIQNQQHLDHNPIRSLSFVSAGAATPSSSIHFQNYPPDMNSRTNCHSQNLCLSLQSFQDSVLLHHSNPIASAEQDLYSASTALVSDATPTSWYDQQRSEMNRFQKMIACNWDTSSGGEEFAFNSLPTSQQSVLSQDQLFSKRESLQSSNLPSIPAWMNLPISTYDHCQTLLLNPSSTFSIGFASDEFLGIHIPAQIHGEEEQNAVSN
ncbi:hypothetical protein L1049_021507 [Liquidambar formosana]|uniref:TCP domain-containing protein n=1 Tax=Liquidambar formosana TaxID=63359 RepID=A0AAP0N1X7_LIQFO